ncbi:hypothetical protein RB195_009242 [Necator americanus]|uniref:Uncharacterized protein n=1 Tax=Necator americanus TaxID=51031 RepID=A0ABR1CSJ3_NECAM
MKVLNDLLEDDDGVHLSYVTDLLLRPTEANHIIGPKRKYMWSRQVFLQAGGDEKGGVSACTGGIRPPPPPPPNLLSPAPARTHTQLENVLPDTLCDICNEGKMERKTTLIEPTPP